jgi:hypothetical protein
MITIHQICYNEIKLLQFAHDFYKKRFPNATFVLHDNNSNDGSLTLAKKLGYKIEKFDTGGKMDDATMVDLKNNCWKNDTTDWVMVVDMDELIDISEENLIKQQMMGASIINTFGFNMVNTSDDFNLENIDSGFREDNLYDKCLIFNKKFVETMDWGIGCHQCNPKGSDVRFSNDRFVLMHYKYINEDYIVKRYKLLKNRQSDNNKNNNWCYQYNTEENELRDYFKQCQKKQLTKLL